MQDEPRVTPYLDQLEDACARTGVSLVEACRAEGIADTTLARWRKAREGATTADGAANCRQATAEKLMARIAQMAAERAGQAA